MARDRRYKSSIPSTASERVVDRFDDGRKQLVKCFVKRRLVGTRVYDEDGHLFLERPLKDGKLHGVEYTWYFDGVLTSAEPYVHGKPHGLAKQWSPSGELIGTYKMTCGTGIDLWWMSVDGSGEAPFYLSEVRYMLDGQLHGYTWWINEDQKSVSEESYFREGHQHGIFREWNERGRLRRGFPQYFVNGNQVQKRQYIRESASDETLPSFHEEDNAPSRVFPKEIRKHLLEHD